VLGVGARPADRRQVHQPDAGHVRLKGRLRDDVYGPLGRAVVQQEGDKVHDAARLFHQ
jgi:hypothetical protein